MINLNKTFLAALIAGTALTVSACGEQGNQTQAQQEETPSFNELSTSAGEALENAETSISEAAEDAGEAIEEAAEDAQDAIAEAVENAETSSEPTTDANLAETAEEAIENDLETSTGEAATEAPASH